ncbi:syncoilin [Pygocentrus nattereri]|uniref:IF rod domain-containing protein n=1 Tax=Pygocentrus nattereri TaxID=42514 RepID=A0A3B4DP42_PYGNA|nr:syncoilin [Pygocentrus nattereri]
MENEDTKFDQAYGPVSEPKGKLEPLFIEGEDEEYFEDCLEELEAAFALPEESLSYSQKCREALQVEFNGLMRQMLAQLDDFDATHETKSTPSAFFAGREHMLIQNGFEDTSKYEDFVSETELSMAIDEPEYCNIEAAPKVSASTMNIKDLGTTFESCIEEVSQLERRKEELVQELLELEKPMAQEVEALRAELRDAKSLLSKARMERQGLQEEIRVVKRRLFFAARDCAQSQVALATQQKEVEQFNQAQEEMKAHVEKLTEEIAQLHSTHQDQLQALQNQKDNITQESSKDKTRSYISQGRRASVDLQQYLQDGIKVLEEWYEPRLVALLKRRESSADALSKSKEQSQELKGQLGPLKDDVQRLGLERARLEERIRLMERQRKENVEQYRETIDLLEENSRELKTELLIQINKLKEMEKLKNSLVKQLYFYRERTEEHHLPEIIMMEEKP